MKVLVLLCAVVSVLADESGQYVPDDEGRYIPDNSGQYIDDGSGRYNGDGSGRYSGDRNERFSGQRSAFGNSLGTAESRRVIQPIVSPSTRSNTFVRQLPRPQPVAVAVPQPRPQPQPQTSYSNLQNGKWKIIRQSNDVDVSGSYRWDYETENKIIAEESGKVYNAGSKDEAVRSKGSYQYTGPDNVVYSVTYTADENGFVPVGNHLPTPPPIPEALAKAIQLNQNRI